MTALLATGAMVSAASAEDWLSLETEEFTVLSLLDERDTVLWATQFSRFVDSLESVLPLNRNRLPPLTVLLFKRSSQFRPYASRRESGVSNSNGVFVDRPSWSVIGMYTTAETFTTTSYHEAVHWFLRADPENLPPWFEEGLAEVFSTFRVQRTAGIWGHPIAEHLWTANNVQRIPLSDLLRVAPRDPGVDTSAFYAWSWLFVHYLIYERLEDGVERLSRYLDMQATMDPEEAFLAAFETSFEDMEAELRDYSRLGRYNGGRAVVGEAPIEYRLGPAPDEQVSLALARLAYGTRNFAIAEEHVDDLLEVSPDRVEAHDLVAAMRAAMASEPENEEDAMLFGSQLESWADRAIALGSRDAYTYQLKVAGMYFRTGQTDRDPYEPHAFSVEDARAIAENTIRWIELDPTEVDTFSVLADALFSVDEVLPAYGHALDLGAAAYPRHGNILIGRAALAIADDELPEARRLIEQALSEDYGLDETERAAVERLQQSLSERENE